MLNQPLLYTTSELQQITNNWVSELKSALSENQTSLVFARNKIPQKNLNPGRILAIVVGGSHLVVSELVRSGENIEILSYNKSNLPVLDSKETLFSLLLESIPADINQISLNFAYALDSLTREGRLDGVLTSPSKEHPMTDLIGRLIGFELEKYLQEKLGRRVLVSVANDVVCLVLAGLSKFSADSLVGGVVGTGLNFGFFLDNTTIINLQSSDFDKFNKTHTGEIICNKSLEPHKAQYEKEISGAYLYQHYNLLAKEMGFDPISSTKVLNEIAIQNLPESKLAQQLFERSASLVATQIAGIYRFKQRETLNLVIEGSLFWEGWNYRDLVYKHLNSLDINLGQVQICKLEKSYLIGAGELIL